MREISLGQYYPTNSPIHNLDPRTKLLVAIAYIVMVFFIDTFIGFGIVAVCLFGTILLSKIPVGKVLKSLKVIIFLVVFIENIYDVSEHGDGSYQHIYQ